MTTTSNNIRVLLWNTLEGLFSTGYMDYSPEWSRCFEEKSGQGPYIRQSGFSGLGYARKKNEGGGIAYDDVESTFLAEFFPQVWALGIRVTEEAFDDNKYKEVGIEKTENLIRSMKQTKEVNHALIFDRATNSSYPTADGLEMCSTVHKLHGGGTFANELTTTANMSEAAIEQAVIDIGNFRDDRGMLIKVMPKLLVHAKDDQFNAQRILKSTNRVGTADNDDNALRSLGAIPDNMSLSYMESTSKWFILTDAPKGLQSFTLKAPTFQRENDFETGDFKCKGYERYVPGIGDVRGIFGNG